MFFAAFVVEVDNSHLNVARCRELGGRGLQFVRISPSDNDLNAILKQQLRGLFAHAAGTAQYDRSAVDRVVYSL